MGYIATAWAWEQPARGNAKLVLLALADSADNETGVCWPGLKAIGRMTGLTPSTISKQIAGLEEDGYLRREERFRKDGSRTSNLVVLDMPARPEGGLDERQGVPTGSQGGLNQSENQSTRPSEKKNKKIALADEPIGFAQWLGQHVAIGERHGILRHVPKSGTTARSDLARMFAALVAEGYELDDFRLVSEALFDSEWHRNNDQTKFTTALRRGEFQERVDKGRRVESKRQSEGTSKWD